MTREDQKLRSDSVRQAILDTALEIGLEEGFEAVSVRKIISRMKYSTGIVYHHFKDKQEIIDAIEASQTQMFYSSIAQLMDGSVDELTKMLKVFRRATQLALDEPEKYNLIVLHKYSRNKSADMPWLPRIAASLEKEMKAGRIKQMNPHHAAFAIWSSFLGFNLMLSRMEGVTHEQADEMFKVQSKIIIEGVINT